MGINAGGMTAVKLLPVGLALVWSPSSSCQPW
jgi:hypothetical protein